MSTSTSISSSHMSSELEGFGAGIVPPIDCGCFGSVHSGAIGGIFNCLTCGRVFCEMEIQSAITSSRSQSHQNSVENKTKKPKKIVLKLTNTKDIQRQIENANKEENDQQKEERETAANEGNIIITCVFCGSTVSKEFTIPNREFESFMKENESEGTGRGGEGEGEGEEGQEGVGVPNENQNQNQNDSKSSNLEAKSRRDQLISQMGKGNSPIIDMDQYIPHENNNKNNNSSSSRNTQERSLNFSSLLPPPSSSSSSSLPSSDLFGDAKILLDSMKKSSIPLLSIGTKQNHSSASSFSPSDDVNFNFHWIKLKDNEGKDNEEIYSVNPGEMEQNEENSNDNEEDHGNDNYPHDDSSSSSSPQCLSMHQPWASLLLSGIKEFEGRGWKPNHKGILWIASTARPPTDDEVMSVCKEYQEVYGPYGMEIPFPTSYPTRSLLGYVVVEDILTNEEFQKLREKRIHEGIPTEDSTSAFVMKVSSPHVLTIPISIKGEHKIYSLPPAVANTIQHAMTVKIPTKWKEIKKGKGKGK